MKRYTIRNYRRNLIITFFLCAAILFSSCTVPAPHQPSPAPDVGSQPAQTPDIPETENPSIPPVVKEDLPDPPPTVQEEKKFWQTADLIPEHYDSLDAALAVLDAEENDDNHPNRSDIEKLVRAIAEHDAAALALFQTDNIPHVDNLWHILFGSTVFEGYELYPIRVGDVFQSDIEREDYLVNLKVTSTDSPALREGNNFKLLTAQDEGYIERFQNPGLPATEKRLAFEALDADIPIITSALYRGFHSADGTTPAAEITITPDTLHVGFHFYDTFANGKELYSQNEINGYLGEHLSGFTPLSALQLKSNINTWYFLEHDEPAEITPDTPLYGCTAGHGGFVYISSVAGIEYSKNDVTVSFYLYADPLSFLAAARTEFVFDISGDEPVLLSVTKAALSDISPCSGSV